MTHELKTIQPYFDAVASGKKTFEARENDRKFEVGDILILKEWSKGEFTGNFIECYVSYILEGFPALNPLYVIMAIYLTGNRKTNI